MDDERQSIAGSSVHQAAPGTTPLARAEPAADFADQPSIVPALAALATSLVGAIGAEGAVITVFDGQNRWITVTHGPVEIVRADPFRIMHEACGVAMDQPATVSAPHRLDSLCGGRLLLAGRVPSRLDALCMSGRSGASRGGLCLVNAAPGRGGYLPGAQLFALARVVMRLLDLHDRLEDYQHVVMLSPHMSCVMDAGGTIVGLDPALRTLLDLHPGPELDRQFRALVHPDDDDALAEAWRQAIAGEFPVEVEYRLRVRQGGYRWFRAHAKPRRDAAGRVTRWCALLEDVHARREDRMRLAHLAYHDALTDLCNRAHFRAAVDARLAEDRPSGFAVARLELHEFRAVTDAFGHAVGDRLLLGASRRLGTGVRAGDLLAHGGGNEFFLLLEGIDTQQQASSVLKAVLHALDEPMQVDGSVVAVGAAVGATLVRGRRSTATAMGPPDADALMQKADLALLRARTAGRGECCFYSPDMDEKIRRIQALKVDMNRALNGDQLFLLYQPVLDVRTGRVTALEALLRWNHPTRGVVPPAEFIAEAENNGLIVPIGQWVLEQGCLEAASWPPLRIGVNLSAVQVRAPGLVDMVAQALRKSGLDPARLVLEITESVPLLGEADNLATLRALSALGVQIALDDFGTGYASLAYLQCFSFDMIKIERSFVQRMLSSAETRIILRAVIRLSRSLNSLSVAEGVETEEQLKVLREEGCDCVQGYLFSRPVEGPAVPATVAALDSRAGSERHPVPAACAPEA